MKIYLVLFLLLTTSLLYGQTPRLVVPIGHTKSISAVAFSPDGKYVLTGSDDNTAKLWDLQGRELQTFSGHTASVNSVDFSPEGKTVLTGSDDNTAKLWDLDGNLLQTFSGHNYGVAYVKFSPGSDMILTGSFDGIVKLWNPQGNLLKTFFEDDNSVISSTVSIAFSPDGKSFLTDIFPGVTVFDLDGNIRMQFPVPEYVFIPCATFSPDSKTIFISKWAGPPEIWGLDGTKLQTLDSLVLHDIGLFSPDGKTILTHNHDFAGLWDLSGRILQTFSGHTESITSIAFSPNGKMVLTGSADNTAKLWDLQGRELQTFSGHGHSLRSVVFSPDGKSILIERADNTASLWNLANSEAMTRIGDPNSVRSMTFSSDGKYLLAGNVNGERPPGIFFRPDSLFCTSKLWDIDGNELQIFYGHTGYVKYVDFSPDGKYILTGSDDGVSKLWGFNGRNIKTYSVSEYGYPISAVVFSPNGKTILTGSEDATAKLWDLDGNLLQSFEGYNQGRKGNPFPSSIRSLAFSPNGKTVLAGASRDTTAKLWGLDGILLQVFTGHTASLNSVVFSPIGTTILTGSDDGTAKLWNLKGRALQTFKGHANEVNSVTFSPDGKTILTASADNTAKFWDAKTGIELATIIFIDSADWVITTPSGLFDASPGAMQQMHYVFGLEVIELEQLKERYYEPGLLAKIMGFSDEPLRSVSGFDSIALYPNVALQLDTTQNRLNIQLSPRNGGTGKVSVFINGKEIIEDANPPQGYDKIRDSTMVVDLAKYARYFLFDTLNTVSVRAYNADDWLKSSPHSVVYQPVFAKSKGSDQTTGSSTLKSLRRNPKLYVLAVGTHKYASSTLNLKYSAKDARDISDALRQVGGQLFGVDSVDVRLLTTDTLDHTLEPTKANIQAAFEQIKNAAKAEDILAVYFSGHGVSYGDADKALFYYLTTAVYSDNLSDVGYRKKATISSAELTRWIKSIPASKQLLILDACNSGRVVENMTAGQKALSSAQIRALDRMKDRTGMFVLTGSAADKVSFEAGQYGQGLLTYSLLEGMKGMALSADTTVDVSMLFEYACNRVPQLAKGIGGVQKPMLVGPVKGSFEIGLKNEAVQIPLEEGKPVFIRCYFQDSIRFDDVLGLTGALKAYFQELTIQPAQADLIYMDVSAYDNGYSIKGRYRREGDEVQVTGHLFKGKEIKGGTFRVQGKANDLPALAENILETIWPMLEK